MKVGVITFSRVNNFGAVLQNFALIQTLSKIDNIKPYTIDYRDELIERSSKIKMIPKKDKNIIKWLYHCYKDCVYYNQRKESSAKFDNFRNEYLNMTSSYSRTELLQNPPELDVYITGSDQVWNRSIISRNIENVEVDRIFTLEFIQNKKKISYAASSGNSKLFDMRTLNYISQLDKILVRETELALFLNKHLQKECETVVDPVLLLSKDSWSSMLSDNRIVNEPYIFVYYAMKSPEVIKIAKKVAKERNLKIVYMNHYYPFFFNSKCCCDKGPLDFIRMIRDAECIVTSSFHATAFSLIFEKELICNPAATTGSRMTDLLDNLGLSKYSVSSYADYLSRNEIIKNVNYKHSREKLAKLRNDSFSKLKSAINN